MCGVHRYCARISSAVGWQDQLVMKITRRVYTSTRETQVNSVDAALRVFPRCSPNTLSFRAHAFHRGGVVVHTNPCIGVYI